MIGIQINNGFLDFANIDFNCPYCNKEYSDLNEKYLDRCNKNKSNMTKIKCSCGKTFGMMYNIRVEAVGFYLVFKKKYK